ncbi:MAG: hypothetical protein ACR2NU_04880 [Aeoliella sp.]
MSTNTWRSICRSLVLGVLFAQCTGVVMGAELVEQVRMLDPRTRELVSIDSSEVEPGKIYNHYSHQRGDYVWAYALGQGRFSYALGPGSVESPSNFALRTSSRETQQLLEAEVYAGTEQSKWDERTIKVRLDDDDKWVARRPSFTDNRSHFDLDSGRRWEWHGSRRVGVVHTNGYLWRYEDGKYWPLNPWLGSRGGGCRTCVICE